MPNPWLNEHKSTAAMNYFLINVSMIFRLDFGTVQTV